MSDRVYHHSSEEIFIDNWVISDHWAGDKTHKVTGMVYLRDSYRNFSVWLRTNKSGRYILINVGRHGSSCNLKFSIPESVS